MHANTVRSALAALLMLGSTFTSASASADPSDAPSVPARFASASLRKVVASGALDESTVQTKVSANLDRLKNCLLDSADVPTESSAVVRAMFSVGKRGFVTDVLFRHERESDEGEPLEPKFEAASTGYESCVETAIRSTAFPSMRQESVAGVIVDAKVEQPARLAPPMCTSADIEKAAVVIENRTSDPIIFSYAGTTMGAVRIAPGADLSREIPEGNYSFSVRSATHDSVAPAFMQKRLADGYVCAWTIVVETKTVTRR